MVIRLAAFFLSALIASAVYAAETPKLDIGKGGQCVEDPKLMRKIHMDLIKHQRNETMRQGIRGGKYSLAECVECHAGTKTNSVLGSNEAFCQGCHVYAAVKLDCFECHSNKRQKPLDAAKTAEAGK
jgi:hypothetical protein